ncbi:LOW QUALITY PROTEIN: seizure 6-like protein [Dryobates pubescens]|uniref:LOW QUALITY PROTEIN: seizure 6-like protein n=1 Tax=Dryobates pubescens TaxID=118200 RepID=UPI0023B9C13F|nr:LOW QUALITY PROTEIN: seizure 6-like protein [Dryobates pubescens]
MPGPRGLCLLALLLGTPVAPRPDSGSGAVLVPTSPDPRGVDELMAKTAAGGGKLGHATGLTGRAKELGHTTGSAGRSEELGHATALNLLPAMERGTNPAAEETTPLVQSHVLPAPTTAPSTGDKQTFPVKKKPPALKQANAARKHPRPKPTQRDPPRAASPTGAPGSRLPAASRRPPAPPEVAPGAGATEQNPPEPAWAEQATTSRPALQISPSTLPPEAPQPSPGAAADAAAAPTAAPAGAAAKGAEREVPGSAAEDSQETTTSTIITTTVITAEPTPALCSMTFHEPEGYIDSTDYPPLPLHSFLECTYNVTVYTGYGVELQVKSVNLSEGEVLSIRGVDGEALVVLANQSLLVEGQVIRSPTNTISVYFRTFQDEVLGTFQLHYQVFMLSCNFPRRPDFGDVTVMDLHSGGLAHFHCHLGYELQGPRVLTCINASRPHWSSPEPICSAPCGGTIHNATIGRVLSPSYPANQTGSMSCVWAIGAPPGQKLHLHFEKLLLTEKDRMVVYSGDTNRSAVLYDSLRADSVPFEGVISDGSAIRIDFQAREPAAATAFNIRFEAFERGHCYEPYIQNGNFTTSDPTYNLGTTVEFTCDPGHSLEQGPAVIECVNMRDPYWNDTEPLCRATCGGELTAVAGVILSPNWPEPYAEGEDCIWRVHVGEEKRLFLDIQLLNLTNSDILTIYDGDELTARILGQYVGSSGPQKLYSSSPDLTIQFHSDPAGLIFGKGQGFIMNYIEVSRNDSCSDLPEIQNGWKTTSHTELVRGAKITYQCDPGYDIVGSDTLTCQWDLSWSSDPPFCEKIMYCTDPGEVEHSTRLISDPVLLVGTTIQYTCNPGFVLEGSSLLTCYSRETGTPIWTSRLPHCVSEESLACDNPGLPENGYQILYKRLYLPGESLTFMCYEGFELMGEVTIKCILGQPSHWSGPLPICKVNQDSFEHALEVAEAAAETSLEGGNMALAIFIPVLIISLLLGGAYIYLTRCRYYSSLRLPLMYSHPYSQITVETEFDNPIYETGETREYEVSI